ncbi:MAG: hypothetical protein E7317_02880 [Clostridiales bacterium]|nr:hypothetical protein [Clostridiales bacterium]
MKKALAMLLVAMIALMGTAFADNDLKVTYDESLFTVDMEDHGDDEDMISLGFVNADWGEGYVKLHLADLDDNEEFPTLDSFAEIQAAGVEVTQGEWAGYKDVFMYSFEDGANVEQTFIAPVYDDDDDDEVEAILTVTISVDTSVDEQAGMDRDDAISDLLNTLKIDD